MVLGSLKLAEACELAYAANRANADRHAANVLPIIREFDEPYFAGSSLILLPPFAMGMTQSGVAGSAELRSVV